MPGFVDDLDVDRDQLDAGLEFRCGDAYGAAMSSRPVTASVVKASAAAITNGFREPRGSSCDICPKHGTVFSQRV